MTALQRLPAKRQLFVAEYLVDLNGAQAAIRAGYSAKAAKGQARRLLADPAVQAAVAEAFAGRMERTQASADAVVEELSRIAFADVRRVATWGEEGVRFHDSDELTEADARTIESVEETETITRDGKSGDETIHRRRKIKMHSKLGALGMLAKHTGVVPAGGGTLNIGGDHRTIVLRFDGGPDA